MAAGVRPKLTLVIPDTFGRSIVDPTYDRVSSGYSDCYYFSDFSDYSDCTDCITHRHKNNYTYCSSLSDYSEDSGCSGYSCFIDFSDYSDCTDCATHRHKNNYTYLSDSGDCSDDSACGDYGECSDDIDCGGLRSQTAFEACLKSFEPRRMSTHDCEPYDYCDMDLDTFLACFSPTEPRLSGPENRTTGISAPFLHDATPSPDLENVRFGIPTGEQDSTSAGIGEVLNFRCQTTIATPLLNEDSSSPGRINSIWGPNRQVDGNWVAHWDISNPAAWIRTLTMRATELEGEADVSVATGSKISQN